MLTSFPHSQTNKKAASSASCQGKRLSLKLYESSAMVHYIPPAQLFINNHEPVFITAA